MAVSFAFSPRHVGIMSVKGHKGVTSLEFRASFDSLQDSHLLDIYIFHEIVIWVTK